MRPIIIATMPRSGSSMVAGLFAAHGVWTGTCKAADGLNEKGYFENEPLKKLLRKRFGHIPALSKRFPIIEPEPPEGFAAEVLRVIRQDGYRSGPWLFKTSVLLAMCFAELDPIYVTVRRARDAISWSNYVANGEMNSQVEEAIDYHIEALDELEAWPDAQRVDSRPLVRGDYAQIDRVFAACGLDFRPTTADEWISPWLWHH